MTQSRAVLFDLDGCLVDSLPSIARCWRETLPEFGLPIPDDAVIRAHVGPPVNVAARSYAPNADAAEIAAIVAAYRARSAEAEDVEPFPGIGELLGALHAEGWTLAVATSKSIEVAEPTLQRLGLRRLFHVVEGTRVDELGTDKATIIARALAGVAPLAVVAHVGDRNHDIEGAHANGVTAVGVLWGYGTREELSAAEADALVASPEELAEYLVTAA